MLLGRCSQVESVAAKYGHFTSQCKLYMSIEWTLAIKNLFKNSNKFSKSCIYKNVKPCQVISKFVSYSLTYLINI